MSTESKSWQCQLMEKSPANRKRADIYFSNANGGEE